MSEAFANPISFLIQTAASLYILAILLRFLLQQVRADFYNPISQLVVKASNPLLIPLRRVIPSVAGMDTAALLLALLLQMGLIYLILGLYGVSPLQIPLQYSFFGALFGLIYMLLNLYTFAVIIIAIASWVAPHARHPGLLLLLQLTEPVTEKIRRVLPPMGGLDFSVMVLLIGIYFIKAYLLMPLMVKLVPVAILKTLMIF